MSMPLVPVNVLLVPLLSTAAYLAAALDASDADDAVTEAMQADAIEQVAWDRLKLVLVEMREEQVANPGTREESCTRTSCHFEGS